MEILKDILREERPNRLTFNEVVHKFFDRVPPREEPPILSIYGVLNNAVKNPASPLKVDTKGAVNLYYFGGISDDKSSKLELWLPAEKEVKD